MQFSADIPGAFRGSLDPQVGAKRVNRKISETQCKLRPLRLVCIEPSDQRPGRRQGLHVDQGIK